jgi:hypothetical protein
LKTLSFVKAKLERVMHELLFILMVTSSKNELLICLQYIDIAILTLHVLQRVLGKCTYRGVYSHKF